MSLERVLLPLTSEILGHLHSFTIIILRANSVDVKVVYIFLVFLHKRLFDIPCKLRQFAWLGDNFHGISNSIFLGNIIKYFFKKNGVC